MYGHVHGRHYLALAVILQSHDVTCEPKQMDDPPSYLVNPHIKDRGLFAGVCSTTRGISTYPFITPFSLQLVRQRGRTLRNADSACL